VIERVQGTPPPAGTAAFAPAQAAPASRQSFDQELRQRIEAETGMRLSNHIQKRLESRQIELSPDHVQRLATAVGKAEDRGSRESVVLMDDLAFVISLRNKTLVTAVDAASRKENVFTNIDSVVIA
jgi:flagellar operon protein